MPFGTYKDFADCVKKNKDKVDNPQAYCAAIERKIKEAQMEKGEHKMTDNAPSNEDKQISVFTEDKVTKLKTIIDKLEKADNIEAAKLLVVEFKSFVEEVTPQPTMQEQPVKTEEKQVETPKVEEVKKEEVAPVVAEAPKSPEPTKVEEAIKEPTQAVQETTATAEKPKDEELMRTQLTDALKLNEKMLGKLKEAEQTIFTLETVNTKLKEDLTGAQGKLMETEQSLFVYREKEQKEAKARYDAKLESVFTKYCDFMGIQDSDRESTRKMMSTYSEDMLDKTLKYVETKSEQKLESEPVMMTKPSSELSAQATVMTREDYARLSAKEKTNYLYEMMISKTKK